MYNEIVKSSLINLPLKVAFGAQSVTGKQVVSELHTDRVPQE